MNSTRDGLKKYVVSAGMVFFSLLSVLPVSAADRNESAVIVFISSSMPDEAIKSIQCQAGIIDAPVVLRGLIDNSLQKTVRWAEKWIKNESDKGFQINPVLFRQYGIKQVPAVLVRNGDSQGIVYGNVTLDYALKTISANQQYPSSVSETAGKALERFKQKRGTAC